jgi:extradiol dioxygenase family protein
LVDAECRHLDFFGHQLLCRLDPEHAVPDAPLERAGLRRFGLTFHHRSDVEALWKRCREAGAPHLSELAAAAKSVSFRVADPSGEVVEFKWEAFR